MQNPTIAEIWLFINENSTHKKAIIPWKIRYQILAKVFENVAKVVVQTKPAPYITNRLFRKVIQRHKYPHHQFWLVIGSDQWNVIENWEEIDKLKSVTNFLVAERVGYPLKLHHALSAKMQTITGLKPTNNASSEIRRGYNWNTLHWYTRHVLLTERYYLDAIIQQNLKPEKYEHVCQVYKMAQKLNQLFNLKQNTQNLYFASMFHDLTKYWKVEQHLNFCRKHQIPTSYLTSLPFAVWHSKTSAWYLENELQFSDPTVIQAIACHTTGDVQMLPLAQLLFVADKIEVKKTCNNAAQIRQMIRKISFDRLFCITLKTVYEQLKQSGKKPTLATVKAIKYHCVK